MREKLMQLLTTRHSARILLLVVFVVLALATGPAGAEDVCAPWRVDCP